MEVATTSIEAVRMPAMMKGRASGSFDPAEDLAAGQAHGLGRVADVGVHLPDPDVGVGEDGRDGQDEQCDERGQEAIPLEGDLWARWPAG